MTLHLQQAEYGYGRLIIQGAQGMPEQEGGHILLGAVKYDFDIIIARLPGVFHVLRQTIFITACQLFTEPIQGVPQRLSPLLVPAGVPA